MDRQSSIDVQRGLFPASLLGELALVLTSLLIAVQSVTAVVLLERRWQGAVALADSPGWLVAWMLTAAIVAATTRAIWFAGGYGGPTTLQAAVIYVPLLSLAATAMSFTALRTPPFALAVVWLIGIAEEAASLFLLGGRDAAASSQGWRRIAQGLVPWRNARGTVLHRKTASRVRERLRGSDTIPPVMAVTDCLAQRLERIQSLDGRDALAGSLTTRFAVGQVAAYLHVAFCPPFAGVPRVEYRQQAGPAARIKVGQILPHGVRFDVKLELPAVESVAVALEVRAWQASETEASPTPSV